MRMSMKPLLAALLTSAIVATGCPVDPATTAPDEPLVSVDAACRTVNSVAVTGEKPAGTRLVAAVTNEAGATLEVNVTEVDDATDVNATVVVTGDGVFTLAFVAENADGVRSKAVGPFSALVDSTPPAVPNCEQPAPQETVAGDVVVDLTCAIADTDVVTLEVDGVAVAVDAAALTVTPGSNNHSVIAVDGCGNRSAPRSLVTLGADDLTAPVGLTVTGPSDIALVSGTSTIAVDFSGAREAGASVVMTVCPSAGCVGSEPATELVGLDLPTPGETSWSATVRLPAGAHLLAFTSQDAAANVSSPVGHPIRVRTFVAVPTLAPEPPTDTNAQALNLSGTRQAGTQVLALIDGVTEPVVLDEGRGGTTLWQGTLDLSTFVDEPVSPIVVTFTLIGQNGLVDGDRSASSPEYTVRVDRTAPDAPALIALDNTLRLEPGTTSGTFAFTGTGEPDATLVVDGVDVGVVAVDGTFSIETTLTATATELSVAQRDLAGNVSPLGTTSFTVGAGLFKPVLTSPRTQDFTFFTREATLTLRGTRRANCGTGACGVEAVNASDGTTVQISAISSSTSWSGSLPLQEGGNTFFLRTFDAGTPRSESALLGLADGQPFAVVQDTTPPDAPEPVAPQGEQGATVSFPILKGEADGLLLRVNDEPTEISIASVLDGSAVVNLVNQPLVPGSNTLCFVTIDRVGNRSDDGVGEPVCVTLIRAVEADLTLTSPQRNDVQNGTTMRVAATFDRPATSFDVCLDDVCQSFATSGASLATTVDLGPVPAEAAFVDVRVCATDGTATACEATRVLRWPASFVVSQSESVFDALEPRVAVDLNGFIHVVWIDENIDINLDCVAPHMDVITSATRSILNPNAGKLVVTTTRSEGFAIGDRFRVVGAGPFDGTYTVGSINAINRTLTTTESVPAGTATQTTGNVFGVDPFVGCLGPDVFYRRYDDAGWSDIVNLSDVGGDATAAAPSIVVDGENNVHVLWQDDGDFRNLFGGLAAESGQQKPDVIHRVIDGLTGVIGVPEIVTPNPALNDSKLNVNAALATGPTDVVATWQESSSGTTPGNIWLSRFTGGVWSTRQLVATGTGVTPAVAVGASGSAYVAWSDTAATDRDVLLCRVLLTDSSCDPTRRLVVSNGTDAGVSTLPRVAVDNGRSGTADDDSVHVVWLDTGNGVNNTLTTKPAVYQRRYRLERILGTTTSAVTRVSGCVSGTAPNCELDSSVFAPAVAAHPASSRVFVGYSSDALIGAEFNVARSLGSDRDLLGQDGVFESSSFTAPSLLTGNGSGTPDADSVYVSAATPDGRNAYVVFARDTDFTNVVDPGVPGEGYDIVIHVVPMQ